MAKALAYVIEDQASLAMLYEDSLRLIGYEVVRISNGLEAINYIELHDVPTLIILDINLPGLSGRDVWLHIRKQARFSKMPVVISTANTLMAARLEQEIGEFDQLLIKPVSLKTLQETAKKWKNQAAPAVKPAAEAAKPATETAPPITQAPAAPPPASPAAAPSSIDQLAPASESSESDLASTQRSEPLPLIDDDSEDDLTTARSKPVDPEQNSQSGTI
jgi:CheY-like chemotaxis protein